MRGHDFPGQNPSPPAPFRGRPTFGSSRQFLAWRRRRMKRKRRDADLRYAEVATPYSSRRCSLSRHPQLYHWRQTLARRFPQLPKTFVVLLALWTLGMILARRCGLRSVALFLARALGRKENTLRQRFASSIRKKPPRRAPSRGANDRDFAPSDCFARCCNGFCRTGRVRGWSWLWTPRRWASVCTSCASASSTAGWRSRWLGRSSRASNPSRGIRTGAPCSIASSTGLAATGRCWC